MAPGEIVVSMSTDGLGECIQGLSGSLVGVDFCSAHLGGSLLNISKLNPEPHSRYHGRTRRTDASSGDNLCGL